MAEAEVFQADVNELWWAVNLCQTAGLACPQLRLRPAKRKVILDLDFKDIDTVVLSVPLLLVKQKKAKPYYLDLFKKRKFEVSQKTNYRGEDTLIALLDRNDEDLGRTVTELYRLIFDGADTDTVNITVTTLQSDIRVFRQIYTQRWSFPPDYKFDAPSARHGGRSTMQVQTKRILNAASFLLYPLVVVLSYGAFGMTGMCWATLAFFGFYTVYGAIEDKRLFAGQRGWINAFSLVLLSLTLATQNPVFVQSIPSMIGASMALMGAALLLGILPPKSEADIRNKLNNPRQYKLNKGLWLFGGTGLLLVSEWARRALDFDTWVWFFGFTRIEFTMAMIVVLIPVFAIFWKIEKNARRKILDLRRPLGMS